MRRDLIKAGTRHLRSTALRLGADCLFYSGAVKLLRHRGRQDVGSSFVVLLYHRVSQDPDPFFPSLSVEAFEAQMRYLAGEFRVLSLGDLLERAKAGREIEPRSIAITFDDGYQDNFLYAHPVLKKYGLPVTLFVPTAYIGSGRALWNDRVAAAIKNTQKRKIGFPFAPGRTTFPLATVEEKRTALFSILEELKSYSEERKRIAVDALTKELQNGKAGSTPPMLTWLELGKMAEEGWEIGSHTVNHAILTRITEAEARRELLASKELLQTVLQKPVRFFSYPNGKRSDLNPRIKALVREAGYEAALTTIGGVNRADQDPLEIRRRSPWEERLPGFAIRLQWSYWRDI